MRKRTMLFEEFDRTLSFSKLLESIESEAKDVDSEVKDIKKELEDEGLDPDETDVKALVLLQAIENDGDLEKIDYEKVKQEAKESLSNKPDESALNEAAGGLVHIIEMIGSIAGNADLMHYLLGLVEKATGKKIDYEDAKEKIEKITAVMKKVSGVPATVLIKTFDWIADKFGVKTTGGKKAVSMVGRIGVLVFLFILGALHFPVLGGGLFMWILSLTGLLGKAIEINHIGKEFVELLNNPKDFEKETGLSDEEVEAMVA